MLVAQKTGTKMITNNDIPKVIKNAINILREKTQNVSMYSLHAAGIIRNGTIITTGYNSRRQMCGGNFIPSTHAEQQVLNTFLTINDAHCLKHHVAGQPFSKKQNQLPILKGSIAEV